MRSYPLNILVSVISPIFGLRADWLLKSGERNPGSTHNGRKDSIHLLNWAGQSVQISGFYARIEGSSITERDGSYDSIAEDQMLCWFYTQDHNQKKSRQKSELVSTPERGRPDKQKVGNEILLLFRAWSPKLGRVHRWNSHGTCTNIMSK